MYRQAKTLLLDAPGMNPYERAREERIASNRARLAALDLPGMASNFVAQHLSKPKKPSKPRGLAAKRQKKVMRQCMPFILFACISCLPLFQALFVSFCVASLTTLISYGADVVRDIVSHSLRAIWTHRLLLVPTVNPAKCAGAQRAAEGLAADQGHRLGRFLCC